MISRRAFLVVLIGCAPKSSAPKSRAPTKVVLLGTTNARLEEAAAAWPWEGMTVRVDLRDPDPGVQPGPGIVVVSQAVRAATLPGAQIAICRGCEDALVHELEHVRRQSDPRWWTHEGSWAHVDALQNILRVRWGMPGDIVTQ